MKERASSLMEIRNVKVYSHTNPEAKQILQKNPRIAQQIEASKLPYWVFSLNSNPIGVVLFGKEPMQLLASPGTPMALVALIDSKLSEENMEAFASETLKLVTQENVEYALVILPFNEDVAIKQFKKVNFKEFDDEYRMVCQLDKIFNPSEELQFIQVKREEMRQFAKLAEKFLHDSPDVALREALKHFPELSDEFLDSWYSTEKFYLARKGKQTVGILSFDTAKGLISGMGVDSQQRGKGYGRQIMLFALERLRKDDCENAYLRVHVQNEPAIHLYESLGFTIAERNKRLIWQKTGQARN